MSLLIWILVLVGALLLTLLASQRAVVEIQALATRIRVPPFFIGLTLVAVGTDLPEIANSIIASLAQHGDLNVGDSVGSTATQVTLILGLLPFIVGAFQVSRSQIVATGLLTAVALILGVALTLDGYLSRLDGGILVASWIVASAIVWKLWPPERELPFVAAGGGVRHTAYAILFLALIGLGATGAVTAFIQLSQLLGAPEYMISFFVASIGTSLPELVVDVSAFRRGAGEIAIGDVFGSSLVDASLSIGIGPLIAPTAVTAAFAMQGGLAAAGVLIIVTLLFSRIRVHDWKSGLILLLLYASFYPLLLWG